MKTLIGLLATVLLCSSATAGELDLSFNGNAVRGFWAFELDSYDLDAEYGLLHNSDEGTMINASIFQSGYASDGENPLQAGLGARSGYIDGDDSDQHGLLLALGGYLKYTFPDRNRLSLRADVYFAPDMLSTIDLERYEDYTVRLAYNFLRNGDIYIGARYVKGEFDNDSDPLFDNGLHLGMNLRF
ncbi:MAG: YfaZ family outer membrane protein [Gammaproteobacteria bacterium]|jgi:hypothetical protein|nr:YfaZ family outer membrane protein [Gammaproteobacteria bacterium]MDP6616485.1 YfaZ family outer membrane protein [Gammaproteobacteria bacterium]MDP6694266.1 YfaZ family outer membrane protein [Gammaproteobacteria bacterium]